MVDNYRFIHKLYKKQCIILENTRFNPSSTPESICYRFLDDPTVRVSGTHDAGLDGSPVLEELKELGY